MKSKLVCIFMATFYRNCEGHGFFALIHTPVDLSSSNAMFCLCVFRPAVFRGSTTAVLPAPADAVCHHAVCGRGRSKTRADMEKVRTLNPKTRAYMEEGTYP